jgi:acyl-CoA synthetase (AMP-forming)/AMP-acid ligase II
MRPWLAHYDADVPATLEPYPERTLLDYLAETAGTHPDRPALLFKGNRMSYAELERQSGAAHGVHAAQGARGRRRRRSKSERTCRKPRLGKCFVVRSNSARWRERSAWSFADKASGAT